MRTKKGSAEPLADMKALRFNPQPYEWRPSRSLASAEEAEAWLVGRYHGEMCQQVATFLSTSTTEQRATSRPPRRHLNLFTSKEI
jgi:hypothetical protein